MPAEEEYLVAARMGGTMSGGSMAGTMAHGDPGALITASMQRLRALDVPAEEIARLRKSGKAQRRIAVRAPADGVVIEKPVQEGMHIEAGQPLYKTGDLSDVWLIAEVQEQDLGMVQPGQSALAQFVAFPGKRFEGKVEFIYPSLSSETRTARVRIVIPNPDLFFARGYVCQRRDRGAGHRRTDAGDPVLGRHRQRGAPGGAHRSRRRKVRAASGSPRHARRRLGASDGGRESWRESRHIRQFPHRCGKQSEGGPSGFRVA
jgi:Barrel-sandwich domain of CusB or HlyD membrane-fusion